MVVKNKVKVNGITYILSQKQMYRYYDMMQEQETKLLAPPTSEDERPSSIFETLEELEDYKKEIIHTLITEADPEVKAAEGQEETLLTELVDAVTECALLPYYNIYGDAVLGIDDAVRMNQNQRLNARANVADILANYGHYDLVEGD